MRVAVLFSPRIAAGSLLAVLLSVVGCHVLRWRNPASPEALLKRADEMSWLNSWIQSEPLYRQAEVEFARNHQLSKALYARVSEMPAIAKARRAFRLKSHHLEMTCCFLKRAILKHGFAS